MVAGITYLLVPGAEQLGLYYRIRLDAEIDWIKYRNRLFLKAYTQPKYQVRKEIREWEKAGRTDKPPSYATFSSRIKQRSGYQQTKKRKGARAAYQQSLFYWELKLTTPRHGDRPFEIGHIDHTQLDIELVCSRTGRSLGRPWATVLIDAYSRRILGVYLTFDEPSYRSCMMVLRICVQRFSRLPETIVVDGGAEFGSTYFETLLADA